jgi:hypothetical protein
MIQPTSEIIIYQDPDGKINRVATTRIFHTEVWNKFQPYNFGRAAGSFLYFYMIEDLG